MNRRSPLLPRGIKATVGALATAALIACGEPPTTPPPVVPDPPVTPQTKTYLIDLRADVNRDGVVDLEDPTDDLDEEKWSATAGAVFLANIDDDQLRCPKKTSSGGRLSDAILASCNDAEDDVVNGVEDLEDLARLKTRPVAVPSTAFGILAIEEVGAEKVRVFKKVAEDEFQVFVPFVDQLTAAELADGVEFAIEALDIVRNPAEWNGFVDVKFKVEAGGTLLGEDTVRLRVSPVMTFHHLLKATQTYASRVPFDPDSSAFQNAISLAATAAGVPNGHVNINTPIETNADDPDLWNQDYMETGYMSMPAPGGGQKSIGVVFRSPNRWAAGGYPLRHAGRAAFLHFRGPDVAGIQEWDPQSNTDMDSLNSFGNTETVPPYTHNGVSYPLGRSLRGSTSTFFPDLRFTQLLEAQGQQPPIYINTEWLLVGHVDESVAFLRATNARGWQVLANDARLAKQMLEDQVSNGNGDVEMFIGKNWYDFETGAPYSARVRITAVLEDADVMASSAEAAVEIDEQLAHLKEETGITDADIIPSPFLHHFVYGLSVAYQPGTVNGIVLSDGHFATPLPHGPMINGQDIFKTQLEAVLSPHDIQVRWVENWDLLHVNLGEVHCGSNAFREIPEARWWESGR